MEMMDIGPAIMGFAVICFVIAMASMIIPEMREANTISKLDKNCYQTEKEIYCKGIGMELGSIVVTPGGIFGGSPYNTEACVSENSEKIIELEDLDYEGCLPK